MSCINIGERMESYYFTFGIDHVNKNTGESLKDHWVEVVSNSQMAARSEMFNMFGNAWAHLYHEREFMKIHRKYVKGCYIKIEGD